MTASGHQDGERQVEDEFAVRLPQGKSITPQRPISKEKTAAKLASVIVWTFSLSLASCFLVVFIHVYREQDIAASLELFKTFAAVMSGPLGFVLGFYFRDGR
ncbi:MAG: hypothetical protein ACFCU8_14320 [Thermosynechococcaceae cyanobacterium]